MMSEDLEMKTEGQSTEQKPTEGSREGYRPASNYASNRPVGRTPRPRIHTTQRAYTTRPTTPTENQGGEGTASEGIHTELIPPPPWVTTARVYSREVISRAAAISQATRYRPRNNYNREGYQPRRRIPTPQQGYRPRLKAGGRIPTQRYRLTVRATMPIWKVAISRIQDTSPDREVIRTVEATDSPDREATRTAEATDSHAQGGYGGYNSAEATDQRGSDNSASARLQPSRATIPTASTA